MSAEPASIHRPGRGLLPGVLLLCGLAACVSVEYVRPGPRVEPRVGQAPVFARIRFVRDGREFFPWDPVGGAGIERHVWLLRLEPRGVSAELHPDPDGTLAVWLEAGDYALVGSARALRERRAGMEVLALLRVPAGAVAAYAGELIATSTSQEGAHAQFSEFGVLAVDVKSLDEEQAAFEHRFGVLPGRATPSPWCAGEAVPGFDDPDLEARARTILDRGCVPLRR